MVTSSVDATTVWVDDQAVSKSDIRALFVTLVGELNKGGFVSDPTDSTDKATEDALDAVYTALVRNDGNVVGLQAGTKASRPSFGTTGLVYIATDTNEAFYDTGSAWVAFGGTVSYADRSGFDPTDVVVDDNAIYSTYDQGGASFTGTWTKGAGTFANGAVHIVTFNSDGNTFAWSGDFEHVDLQSTLPTSLTAGLHTLMLMWNAARSKIQVSIATTLASSIAATTHNDISSTTVQAQLEEIAGRAEPFTVAISDETSDLTTGMAKATFRMPFAATLSAVRASVTTAPTGSAIIIDINETAASVLSTELSIDAGELTSTTAATPAVIDEPALADDAEMTIDIDQIGSSTAGAGAKVTLYLVRT